MGGSGVAVSQWCEGDVGSDWRRCLVVRCVRSFVYASASEASRLARTLPYKPIHTFLSFLLFFFLRLGSSMLRQQRDPRVDFVTFFNDSAMTLENVLFSKKELVGKSQHGHL